jgi:hypothetical protein
VPIFLTLHVNYFPGKKIFSTYISIRSSRREREDRQAIKKEDFILDKLKDQTIYRLPGSINGQQFIGKIKNLKFHSLIFFSF